MNMSIMRHNNKLIPYVKIIEQPASKRTRFRYECEGRYAGSIFGEKTTSFKKSFPTIEIVNYKGPAFIVVSCVSKDPPYSPHPHNIIGKTNDEASNGIYYLKITSEEMTVTFNNLGIQCVKRKDIKKSLTTRKNLKVDPFNAGFSHMSNPEKIDLYCLRLCFQVFIEGKEKGNFNIPLEPVVSNPIHDKKTMASPIINFLSHDSASVAGGTEMCILCEKATKENVQVRFFREENNWEAIAELTPPGVFKHVSIVFKSPQYFLQDINEPIDVRIQLRRISDGETSESMPFQFLPLKSSQNYSFQQNDYGAIKRKRQRNATISEHIQLEAAKNADLMNLTQINNPNVTEIQPWELPLFFKKSSSFEQLPTFLEQDVNELNVYRDQPISYASTNKYNNFHDLPFNILKKPSTLKSQLHFNESSSNVNQFIDQNTESLNSDDWIKELIETVERNDSTPIRMANNYNNENKIKNEPEANYIVVDSNTTDSLLGVENTDNFPDIINRQTNNYQVSSSSENLSKCFSISNLIKISTNVTKDFDVKKIDVMKNNPYKLPEDINLNINKSTEITSKIRMPNPTRRNITEKDDQSQISEFDAYYLLNHREERAYNKKPQDLILKHLEAETVKYSNLQNEEKSHDFNLKSRRSNKVPPPVQNSLASNQSEPSFLQLNNNNINTFSEISRSIYNRQNNVSDYNGSQEAQWSEIQKITDPWQNSQNWQSHLTIKSHRSNSVNINNSEKSFDKTLQNWEQY